MPLNGWHNVVMVISTTLASGDQGLEIDMSAVIHKYSGHAYQFDDIDSRADVSQPHVRRAVAAKVLRSRAPWARTPAEIERVTAWARNTLEMRTDALPPAAVTSWTPVKFPDEPASTNGQRSESNRL